MSRFASRSGEKLDHALDVFDISVQGVICADLGSNAGGFVDCLLMRGAARVYAVDTGYGALDWKLRKDPRVVVMERTNAMHVQLPEKVGLVTIDVAWTKQRHILPAARTLVADEGIVVTLIKPHYEAAASSLRNGVLPAEQVDEIVESIRLHVISIGFEWVASTPSPMLGHKGNMEVLAKLRPMPML